MSEELAGELGTISLKRCYLLKVGNELLRLKRPTCRGGLIACKVRAANLARHRSVADLRSTGNTLGDSQCEGLFCAVQSLRLGVEGRTVNLRHQLGTHFSGPGAGSGPSACSGSGSAERLTGLEGTWDVGVENLDSKCECSG